MGCKDNEQIDHLQHSRYANAKFIAWWQKIVRICPKFRYLLQMIYHIDCADVITQYLKVSIDVKDATDGMLFHLPIWRPGRYEAANYARNLRNFKAVDSDGNALVTEKTDHSTWNISVPEGSSDISISYEYYAAELNAGSTLIDEEIVYINFINCLLYNSDRIISPCQVHVNLPDDFISATSLSSVSRNTWEASGYYELADSPLLAAPDLMHLTYSVDEVCFHIWVYGEVALDQKELLAHFQRFSEEQVQTMGDFPEEEYHFLIITAPYKLYHGVEHAASTVICLGPAGDLADNLYDEFLGISSHELFHAWNILKIRPAELLPYQFNQATSFNTGFVAEGFTTYLGDLFLVRSGVKNQNWYLAELGKLFKRHFENFGRLNTSLADSSIDLWLDGYQAGAPHRKSSIYVEGAVVGLMLDMKIRLATDHDQSLLTLMKILYNEFAKKTRGYMAADIVQIAEKLTGEDLFDFFHSYVFGTKNTRPQIDDLFVHYGLTIVEKMNDNPMESVFGARVSELEDKWKVIKTAPGSEGEINFRPGDQIMKINGESPINIDKKILDQPILTVGLQRNGREKSVTLEKREEQYFPTYDIVVTDKSNENLQKWLKL